ncbi:MAG: cupin domain-containing protein [Beijerinckiaceae bacterium]
MSERRAMSEATGRNVLILQPGEGRHYGLGAMTAVFKADENETACHYSISEWWMEPGFAGVGAHSHEANDEIFYVVMGTPGLLVGTDWMTLEEGAFVRIPAGITHDFRNLSGKKCGLLNVFIPGGFERNMPAIVQWFKANPGSNEI